MLLIWDRAQIHRSGRVRHYLERAHGRITTAFLPAYAPELNPVEYLWAYWKKERTGQLLSLKMSGNSATSPPRHSNVFAGALNKSL